MAISSAKASAESSAGATRTWTQGSSPPTTIPPCSARGFFSLSKGNTSRRSSRSTATPTYQACRLSPYATPNCVPMASRAMLASPGFAKSAPRSAGTSIETMCCGQAWPIPTTPPSLPALGNRTIAQDLGNPPPAAATSARRGNATINLTFDFRARQHAIMYGNALGFQLRIRRAPLGKSVESLVLEG
jgi:hypothetical protein